MLIYEQDNALKIRFAGSDPAAAPDVIIEKDVQGNIIKLCIGDNIIEGDALTELNK